MKEWKKHYYKYVSEDQIKKSKEKWKKKQVWERGFNKKENAKMECYYVHSIKGFYYKMNN